MARGSRACSRAARAMTVTGLCSANRSKMLSRTMAPPPWKITISRCGDTLADVSLQLQSPGVREPGDALLAHRASHHLTVPVHREAPLGEARAVSRLPAGVLGHRADDRHAVLA